MKIRSAERVERFKFAALVFALAILACISAMASDVEWQIPMIRATVGSGLAVEMSREGTRQTATPFLTLPNPAIRQIEDRIARIVKMTARSAVKEIPSGATDEGSHSRIGLTGTPREDSGRPESARSSLPPAPKEITVRGVRGFLKGLRASRKDPPVPAVAVAVPEQRL